MNISWQPHTTVADKAQFNSHNKELMMLPAELAFLQDEAFKGFIKMYAEDSQLFIDDFTKTFQKLVELGCSGLT